VVYLTVLSFVDYHTFFFVIAGSAILGLIALAFMEEPQGHMAEVREDGTVELISIERVAAH
jgi:NNP family nitrate/nitrite transporter-like MFS transporter